LDHQVLLATDRCPAALGGGSGGDGAMSARNLTACREAQAAAPLTVGGQCICRPAAAAAAATSAAASRESKPESVASFGGRADCSVCRASVERLQAGLLHALSETSRSNFKFVEGHGFREGGDSGGGGGLSPTGRGHLGHLQGGGAGGGGAGGGNAIGNATGDATAAAGDRILLGSHRAYRWDNAMWANGGCGGLWKALYAPQDRGAGDGSRFAHMASAGAGAGAGNLSHPGAPAAAAVASARALCLSQYQDLEASAGCR
jgi:hypothetical protein